MKWRENLLLYIDTKRPGKCPKCNSENIEVTEHHCEYRMSVTFRCKDCGSSEHVDGCGRIEQKGKT